MHIAERMHGPSPHALGGLWVVDPHKRLFGVSCSGRGQHALLSFNLLYSYSRRMPVRSYGPDLYMQTTGR